MSPDLDSFLSLVQSLYRVVETPGTAESRGHHVDSQEGRQEEEGKEGTLLFHFNLVCIHFMLNHTSHLPCNIYSVAYPNMRGALSRA